MRDLAFVGFILALLALGLRRPFLFTLAYLYVDTVSPHRLSYYLLNSLPLSLIVSALAIGGWLAFERKDGVRVGIGQVLILLLVAYCGMTTMNAEVQDAAWEKWDWVWKGLVFAFFLPLTLRSKLRIEAALLFLTLSAGAISIVGGIKTMLSGGGYGVLNLMVDNNSGLYESSTISTIAIGLIPLILWFMRHGTIFPTETAPVRSAPDSPQVNQDLGGAAHSTFREKPKGNPTRMIVKMVGAGLIFACLLMPIGTEARTGLICIGVLAVLMLRDAKRRLIYMGGAALLGLAAIPFLPASFTERMGTISGYQADQSANVRLAVWQWTLDYAGNNPLGGGFGAYRLNRIQVQTVDVVDSGEVAIVRARMEMDQGRAWHSSYFEMLGEQGWPGLFLFLTIHGIALTKMELIRRRYRRREGMEWASPLATALQHFQLIYLVGSLFVGIAFVPFAWLMLAAQFGFDAHLKRLDGPKRTPFTPNQPIAATSASGL